MIKKVIGFVILLLFSCSIQKQQTGSLAVSWNSILCNVIMDQFPEFVTNPIDECIRINPVVIPGGERPPDNSSFSEELRKKGEYLRLERIPKIELTCIPEVEVSYDINYERIGCHCTISFYDPYLLDNSSVYIQYDLNCGVGNSSGYGSLYKIQEFPQYDLIHNDLLFVE